MSGSQEISPLKPVGDKSFTREETSAEIAERLRREEEIRNKVREKAERFPPIKIDESESVK